MARDKSSPLRGLSALVAKVRSKVTADKHPKTVAALEALKVAARSEFKFKFSKGLPPTKTLQNKINYLANKVKALQSQVQTYTSTKTSAGRVTQEWILRSVLGFAARFGPRVVG